MGEWSWLNAMNLSRILTCFNLASGLKINFHKSKLYGVGVTTLEVNSLASMIGCLPSNFPCTYLGLPIGGNMSRCANWGILADKFNKRLSNWKAMSLSFGGRVTLIKSILGSLGDKATSSISNGGLGIGTLKSSNLATLSKWWWRFHTENHAFWCKIIRSIHGVDGGINDTSLIKSKSGPWYRIAKLKDDLSKIGIDLPSIFKKKIGDGCLTFNWAWSRPIRSSLELCELSELCNLVAYLRVSDNGDLWECVIDDSRAFSVKMMRSYINQKFPTLQVPPTRWNTLLPLKVNIFIWRTTNKRLLTRANLDYRGIDLDSVCCPMCDDAIETEDHIFVSCPIAKDTWKCIEHHYSQSS
ncbi:RNA-directed DNA polymerase, eukaryota, reverse transcriptase zinc-binding domain protein [Tanacetum coccineum]